MVGSQFSDQLWSDRKKTPFSGQYWSERGQAYNFLAVLVKKKKKMNLGVVYFVKFIVFPISVSVLDELSIGV